MLCLIKYFRNISSCSLSHFEYPVLLIISPPCPSAASPCTSAFCVFLVVFHYELILFVFNLWGSWGSILVGKDLFSSSGNHRELLARNCSAESLDLMWRLQIQLFLVANPSLHETEVRRSVYRLVNPSLFICPLLSLWALRICFLRGIFGDLLYYLWVEKWCKKCVLSMTKLFCRQRCLQDTQHTIST